MNLKRVSGLLARSFLPSCKTIFINANNLVHKHTIDDIASVLSIKVETWSPGLF